MTTLADIRRIFSIRGVDPDHLSQAPDSDDTDARFLFSAATGARVWFAPHEQDGQRLGWAYSAWNRHDELTEAGHTDSTAPESVLPVLSRHRKPTTTPASPRQLDTLLTLSNPDEHAPLQLRTDSPAGRWILGLFVAWTRLQDADDGNVNGGDLVPRLGQAFAAIGLTEQLGLDELATRVDPGPRPTGSDPAAPVIATYLAAALDRSLDQQLGVLTVTDLAAEIAAGLRRAGHLATDPAVAHRAGQESG
jgi:hypothetical protein